MANEKKSDEQDKPKAPPLPVRPDPEARSVAHHAIEERRQELQPGQSPDPKKAMLKREMQPDGKTPVDQPPTPPVAGTAPIPRVIHQNERAPVGTGLKRFKVKAQLHTVPPEYVLARNKAEAEACYLDHTRLGQAIEDVKAAGMAPDRLAIFCKELPD